MLSTSQDSVASGRQRTSRVAGTKQAKYITTRGVSLVYGERVLSPTSVSLYLSFLNLCVCDYAHESIFGRHGSRPGRRESYPDESVSYGWHLLRTYSCNYEQDERYRWDAAASTTLAVILATIRGMKSTTKALECVCPGQTSARRMTRELRVYQRVVSRTSWRGRFCSLAGLY